MRLIGMIAVVFVTASVVIAEDQELTQLIRQLDAGKLDEKTKAVQMLGEIGPAAADAVPSVVKLLDGTDIGLRHEAVVALGRINSSPKLVVPVLNRLLSDNVPVIRLSAIESLRMFGTDAGDSIPQLTKLLDDKELLIGVGAARAIVEIRAGKNLGDARIKAVLVAGLKSDRGDVSAEAIQGLALIGSDAVPAIQEVVAGTNLKSSVNACDAIAAIGPGASSAVDSLLVAAKSSEAVLRWHAINAIAGIGPAAKSAIPMLITALEDGDFNIKFIAEQGLHKIGKAAVPALIEALKKEALQHVVTPIIAEIGPDAAEAVPALAGLLPSKNPQTRREAILALAGIGAAAKPASAELIKILADKQFAYRPAAAFALGKIEAKEAVAGLKDSMQTTDNQMLRLASVWALLQLDPSNEEYVTLAVPQLTAALEAEKLHFRLEAAKALGRIGSRAKKSVPALQKCLADKAPEVQRESLVALAEIGPDSAPAVSDIIKILNEGEPSLRPIAIYALGRIGAASKPAIAQLNRSLFSRDPHEKTMAAWALVSIAPEPETIKSSLPLLVGALLRSDNPEARAELARTLGKIGSNSPEAKEALKTALKDTDESVRKAAELALGQLK